MQRRPFLTGWDWMSAKTSCNDNSNPLPTSDVSPGETVTCTFNNTQKRGNIVIKKVTDPAGSAQSFPFTLKRAVGTDVIEPFNLVGWRASKDSGSVLAGSGYNAAETVPDGWDLDLAPKLAATTIAPLPTSTSLLGETVTCTFNNTQKRGNIVIDKVTYPAGSAQPFPFTLKG